MKKMPTAVLLSNTEAILGEPENTLPSTEKWIVEGCIRKDRQAMEALYHRYKGKVYSVIVRMTGSQEAEELTQDVFVRVFHGLSRFRGEAALSTWIYRITLNVCFNHLSKQKRRGRLHQSLDQEYSAEPQPGGNPWLKKRLEVALKKLPEGYRAVIILHDVEGLNHEEIANILNCRVGTSKSQLHKARMRMRELLEPMLERAEETP